MRVGRLGACITGFSPWSRSSEPGWARDVPTSLRVFHPCSLRAVAAVVLGEDYLGEFQENLWGMILLDDGMSLSHGLTELLAFRFLLVRLGLHENV